MKLARVKLEQARITVAQMGKLPTLSRQQMTVSKHTKHANSSMAIHFQLQTDQLDDAKEMAQAIVGSSMKTLERQLLRLFAAVVVVPLLSFLPRLV
jgi:hypothetical protein